MKITFFGAARNVTGSKHLIETNGYKLLLDCGLYQGKRQLANTLNKELPFTAHEIDAVILSHAHLDHCGTLPILVREGFAGKIYATPPTCEIAQYIMADSAFIQEHDAEYFNRHAQRKEDEIEPIYTVEDAKKVAAHFEPVPYFRESGVWTELSENIRFKFYDAGHILGSSIIVVEIKEEGTVKTIAFTGDLGRNNPPILRQHEQIAENTDILLSECTYGDRLHRPLGNVLDDLQRIILSAVKNKSKIIVPAFALGRVQELIYFLHELVDRNLVPLIPIYLDTPLGENITSVFSKYTRYFNQQFFQDFGNKEDTPFLFTNLVYVNSVEESKVINDKKGPLMIIASSGMVEGGRILHHLKNNIEDSNTIVLITGYQAQNTLGRRLQEGVSPVKIFGKEYAVRAKILTLSELSAHADQNDLLSYIGQVPGLQHLFLVHTEPQSAEAFEALAKKSYPELKITIPDMGQAFEL